MAFLVIYALCFCRLPRLLSLLACAGVWCVACAVSSSVAMILNTRGVNVNPGTLNAWLDSNGGYADGCDIYWGKVDSFGKTSYQGQETVRPKCLACRHRVNHPPSVGIVVLFSGFVARALLMSRNCLFLRKHTGRFQPACLPPSLFLCVHVCVKESASVPVFVTVAMTVTVGVTLPVAVTVT